MNYTNNNLESCGLSSKREVTQCRQDDPNVTRKFRYSKTIGSRCILTSMSKWEVCTQYLLLSFLKLPSSIVLQNNKIIYTNNKRTTITNTRKKHRADSNTSEQEYGLTTDLEIDEM